LNNRKLLLEHLYSPNNKRLLSACTFNRPVSVYFSGDAIILLPVLPQEKMKVSMAALRMHHLMEMASPITGYDEAEALNLAEVAHN